MSILTAASLLVAPITELLGKFITDKDEANKLAHDIATMAATQAHQQNMAQAEINKVEAGHRTVWVAGWRPFIGWTCGLGLFYNVLLHPVLDIWFTMPAIEPQLLYPVMMGILGIGGTIGVARTYEKVKGVAK